MFAIWLEVINFMKVEKIKRHQFQASKIELLIKLLGKTYWDTFKFYYQ